MLRILLRRLTWMLLTLALVATITFFLTFLLPRDVARTIAGDKASDADVALVRAELGLNDSLPVQYGRYMAGLARLDFGYSYVNREPVSDILAQRLPRTMMLAIVAITFQLVVGIVLGLATASRAGGVLSSRFSSRITCFFTTSTFLVIS